MIGMIVDWLIIALLFAVMALGVLVHIRLRALQRALPEIEPVIAGLGDLAARAEAASAGLKSVAAEVDAGFATQLDSAQRLADELRLLTDRGDRAAERLSEAIRRAREPAAVPPDRLRRSPPDGGGSGPPATRAEIEWALSRLR